MSPAKETLLAVIDLGVSLVGPPRQQLFSAVNLELHRGEAHALIGASGSGKTTLVRAILGMLPREAVLEGGQILLKGEDLLKASPKRLREIRGGGVGYVPQEPMAALNPVMRVDAQLIEGMIYRIGLDRKKALERGRELLSEVGVADPERVLRSYPFELSGGLCQRVLIAAALSCEPEVLLCDEPTSALDVTTQNRLLAVLQQIQKKRQLALLLITHDTRSIGLIADRISTLQGGRIVSAQPTVEGSRRQQEGDSPIGSSRS